MIGEKVFKTHGMPYKLYLIKCKDKIIEESTWIFEDKYQNLHEGKLEVDVEKCTRFEQGHTSFYW